MKNCFTMMGFSKPLEDWKELTLCGLEGTEFEEEFKLKELGLGLVSIFWSRIGVTGGESVKSLKNRTLGVLFLKVICEIWSSRNLCENQTK